jgi:GT2 family glycosyltransferase
MWRHLDVPRDPKIHLVAATKLSEEKFWSESLLGRSLVECRNLNSLTWNISFENRRGLPWIYNRAIEDGVATDILICVHDDVWFADADWLEKVIKAVGYFDVVGVAGNTRRQPGQCTWAFNPSSKPVFDWDHPYLSGQISHGSEIESDQDHFGPTPARVQLLDGVFIAANARLLRASQVRFDTRFTFNFYDLDFCRTARKAGLSLGTWPIAIVHASEGSFDTPSWRGAKQVFLGKWPD